MWTYTLDKIHQKCSSRVQNLYRNLFEIKKCYIKGEKFERMYFIVITVYFTDITKEVTCDNYAQVQYDNLGNSICACPVCSSTTTSDSTMVCATDGSTYANECWMKRNACLKQTPLVVVKLKPCGNFIH